MTKRSTTANKYRKLYSTKQWRTLRGTILTYDHYRCQQYGVSLTSGKSQPTSAVVNHKKPHKGNLTLFYDPSNLEAVCWNCHLGVIQSEEALSYDATIGDDGWPVDEKHPTNVKKNMIGIFKYSSAKSLQLIPWLIQTLSDR